MYIVNPLTRELAVSPEPGELILVALGFLAAVLAPFDVWFGSQDAGAFLAAEQVLDHEGADIEAHAVVDVGLPANGLFLDGFPAHEEVKRRFPFENGDESLLQLQCRERWTPKIGQRDKCFPGSSCQVGSFLIIHAIRCSAFEALMSPLGIVEGEVVAQ